MRTLTVLMLTLFLMLFSVRNCNLNLNEAQARPGGGHSSSIGSGHSSYSGSSGSSRRSSGYSGSSWGNSYTYGNNSNASPSAVEFFFVLLVVVILIIVLINLRSPGPQRIYSAPTEMVKNWQSAQLQNNFAQLKAVDPNFSTTLLLDFLHSLYCKYYSYAGKPEFSYLSPFLNPNLQYQSVTGNLGGSIDEVVINGIQCQEINLNNPQQDELVFLIEANYSQHLQNQNYRYTVTERWKLSRNKGLISQEPKKMQALSCPHCAAPAHFNDAGICPYCKTLLQQGAEQWFVKQRAVVQTEAFALTDAVAYAQEAGTELSTVKAPDLPEQIGQFVQIHQLANWDSFWADWRKQIVEPYFFAIYQHWSQRDWNGVRHLLSDRLYEANQFWTDRYQQHNWFNRLEQLNIERVVLAKLDLDKFYEAITVRIFASCFDYTEDGQGKLIGGSKRTLRRYSEYWTFVRRANQTDTPAEARINQCPHCGAPADQMGQAGECGYCGSKISTGEFSWVLFLIMQDDTYNG